MWKVRGQSLVGQLTYSSIAISEKYQEVDLFVTVLKLSLAKNRACRKKRATAAQASCTPGGGVRYIE